jgi:hypothetical protein
MTASAATSGMSSSSRRAGAGLGVSLTCFGFALIPGLPSAAAISQMD